MFIVAIDKIIMLQITLKNNKKCLNCYSFQTNFIWKYMFSLIRWCTKAGANDIHSNTYPPCPCCRLPHASLICASYEVVTWVPPGARSSFASPQREWRCSAASSPSDASGTRWSDASSPRTSAPAQSTAYRRDTRSVPSEPGIRVEPENIQNTRPFRGLYILCVCRSFRK